VILLLDTLRLDYSSGLDSLLNLGFIKYENAVAPSPWTLPSHVSMFTGMLPSMHEVHEDKNTTASNISDLATRKLKHLNLGVVGELRSVGYTDYGLSANPFVTRAYSFDFQNQWFYDFGFKYLFDNEDFNYWFKEKSERRVNISLPFQLLKTRKLRLAKHVVINKNRLVNKYKQMISEKYPLEKGSKNFLNLIKKLEFKEPFFLFVNLMESHGPYFWNESSLDALYASLLDKRDALVRWLENFPVHKRYMYHSELAISRAAGIVHLLKKYLSNSLIVVTSDHGHLLGENSLYGHGYYLKDETLRVPFYVKYPLGLRELRTEGGFISLSHVPLIIRYALYGDNVRLDSKYAFAESFGPQEDLFKLAKNPTEKKRLSDRYSHRVKVYNSSGAAVYNMDTELIEEVKGNLDKKKIQEVVSWIQ